MIEAATLLLCVFSLALIAVVVRQHLEIVRLRAPLDAWNAAAKLEAKDYPGDPLILRPVIVCDGKGVWAVIDGDTQRQFAFTGCIASQIQLGQDDQERPRINIVIDRPEIVYQTEAEPCHSR